MNPAGRVRCNMWKKVKSRNNYRNLSCSGQRHLARHRPGRIGAAANDVVSPQVQALFFRRRHQPRRPPQAKISREGEATRGYKR
jgi:hypothetical protein